MVLEEQESKRENRTIGFRFPGKKLQKMTNRRLMSKLALNLPEGFLCFLQLSCQFGSEQTNAKPTMLTCYLQEKKQQQQQNKVIIIIKKQTRSN